ncbi:ADP-ribose pyrophosphatase YjhB (NUDIX family) [Peribacillus deserti]|uniref:ADP-ribose pyrophosphatase YjhB (NUDIX family) n=1 Tax=Peribacillus deserti TaxID=673318 RepID=A0ABS2QDD2_9BACI|nr:ADP-ribose pyrophosphatase YjhB (NUDIX family) [Peribacillus deserti]
MSNKWLEWAKQIQSLSQAGLTYSRDVYDKERFQALREISAEMVSELAGTPIENIRERFTNETGYQTPKVDVRAVIFHEQKLLLVKEKHDHLWALPGGWADIGLTASETAVKETREETGFVVSPSRLLAVLDKKCHPHPPSLFHVYKFFILCELEGGAAAPGLETSEVRFFAEDNLPPLSIARNTEGQIQLMFEYLRNPLKETLCD